MRLLDATCGLVRFFADDAISMAAAQGFGYLQDLLTQLSDGKIVVSALGSVAVIAADGAVEWLASPCFFEERAYETSGGLLAVPCAMDSVLLDPDTLATFETAQSVFDTTSFAVHSLPFDSQSGSQAARFCAASPNSSGRIARVSLFGSTESTVASLSVVGSAMPSGSFALPIFGAAPYDVPFGNGRLCVSPFAPGIFRGPVSAVSDQGGASVQLEDAGGGASTVFTAGATWYFQYLFRDGGSFDTTDGTSITFRP